MRMSQVDVEVLRELPAALQKEVVKSIEAHGGGFKGKLGVRGAPKAGTSTTPMTQAPARHHQEQRDLDRRIESLSTPMEPILKEAVDQLHRGSSTGFIATLERWLQARESCQSDAPAYDHITHQLAEVIATELESPASRISTTAIWSLIRGLRRLGASYDATFVSIAEDSAAIMARRHNILVV